MKESTSRTAQQLLGALAAALTACAGILLLPDRPDFAFSVGACIGALLFLQVSDLPWNKRLAFVLAVPIAAALAAWIGLPGLVVAALSGAGFDV